LATIGNGGGMYNSISSPMVTNCTFSGNSAAEEGGGMSNSDSSPTVTNCMFSGNSAGWGGGMYNIANSSPTVTNCTFTGNTAFSNTYGGGGMFNYLSSSPTVTNCTFSGNQATVGSGGGMFNHLSSSPTVTNCILWGDTPDEFYDNGDEPTVTYSNIQGGWGDPNDPNNTNIDADPLFVDANNPDPNLRNLRLKLDSPCIDAGDSTVLLAMEVAYDLDGKDRYFDIDSIDDTGSGLFKFLDMGAYEFQCSGIVGDINCDGVVNFKDMAILAGNWLAGTEPEL
jgi:parallel beta-helix repeat protein